MVFFLWVNIYTDCGKIHSNKMFPDDKISYITDEQGKKIVQMDIDVFEAIRSYIEDEGLLRMMLEKDKDNWLSPEEAKAYYDSLPKQS